MNRELKKTVYGEFARFGKALANAGRLEILDLLSQGPKTVDEVSRATTLAFANTSQHLKVLKGSRLVKSEKIGTHVLYSLADQAVSRFLVSFRSLATRQLAEVERAVQKLHDSSEGMLPKLSGSEFAELVRNDKITLLDVRPADEYAFGHLPGSWSIPWTEMAERACDLPLDKPIVAYCRGPYCTMAVEAVRILHSKGYSAMAIPVGVSEWRALGRRVATAKAV